MWDTSMWDEDNVISSPFPEEGEIGNVYIETTDKQLYLWDNDTDAYVKVGDSTFEPRITNLENTNVKQTIWEEITSKGIDNTVNNFNGKTSVDTTIWDSSPYNSEAKKVDSGGNYTGEDIFTASGTHIKSIIDSNGDYLLSGIPNPTLYPRYAIIYNRKGTAKEFGEEGIPSSQILEVIETPAMVRDVENSEIKPKNDGDNLNMETGGFKDSNVSIVVPLGSADDPVLQTLKKNLLGAINEANLRILSSLGSGKWSGLVISKSGTNKFNVGAGVYVIVDNYTDQDNPTFTFYLFAGQNDITPTYLPFANATFVGMSASGIYQSPYLITPDQKKTIIPIGTLIHTDQTTVQYTSSTGIVLPSIGLEFIDFLNVLGPRFNEKGNDFSANGSNVNISKSEGIMIGTGVNYDNSFKNPHTKTLPFKSVVSFLRVKRGVSIAGTVPSTDIDTAQYDPNGDGTLVDIPNGEFVAHRIMIVPEFGTDGLTLIQYGQKSYDTMKNALDSFQKEEFEKIVEAENIHIRCAIIVKHGATDLSDRTQANFVNFGRLGEVNFTRNPRYAETSSAVPVISGMSDQRQVISFVNSGGVLYADIGKSCNLKRNDISFIASDKSINTSGGDFTECNPQIGDKIIVYDSVNNNGAFTIASVTSTKIIVNETIIDESAGSYIFIEFGGNGDITFNFNDWKYILDCTTGSGVGGRARIALTAGTDTVPQENWLFTIPSGEDAILQQSLTEPDPEDYPNGLGMVCSVFVPSVTETVSIGAYNSRRWTDTKNVDGRGVIATILSKLRDRTDYKSGLGATITIDTAPTPDSVDFTVASGVVREIYKQRINALQLSIDSALIVNDPTTAYRKITDLNVITVDSTGASLNNKYFQLIIAVSLNTDGYPDRLLINLPNGSYINAQDAFDDINNYSVTTFPAGFKSVYLLFAGVFKITGGNVWTNEALSFGINNIDLRGQPLGVKSSGSGTSAVTEFSDTSFGVYDEGDNTKLLRLQCSGISTGTTRLWTVPNRNLDLGNPIFDSLDVDDININGTIIESSSQLNLRGATTSGVLVNNIGDGAKFNIIADQGTENLKEFIYKEHSSAGIIAGGGIYETVYLDNGIGLSDDTHLVLYQVSDVTLNNVKAFYSIVLLDEAGDGLQTRFIIDHDGALNLPTSGSQYEIGGTSVLNATTLGVNIVNSSLTSLGTIASLVATTADINGGTIDGVTIGTNSACTDLIVDNLQLDGNTISSTNTNGDITITPNGTGNILSPNNILVGDTGGLYFSISGNIVQFHRDANPSYIDQFGTGSIRFRFGASATTRVRFENNGNIYFPEVYNNTTASSANRYIDSAGLEYRSTCGEYWKKNLRDIEIDTSKIYDVSIKTFEEKTTNKTYSSIVADENTYNAIPEIVIKSDALAIDENGEKLLDENGESIIEKDIYDSLNWNLIITAMLCEMKKLKQRIDIL